MKLWLNLNTPPRENKRPFLLGSLAVGVVALIAFAILSHSAFVSWQANRAYRSYISPWESEIRTAQQKRQALEVYFHSGEAQQVLQRSAFLNWLIGERSFPWTKIFMDLEKNLPAGVRVVNIAPTLRNGKAVVQITVGAATDESKIKFLEELEKSPAFSNVQVQEERHSEQQTAAADQIVLQLTAWYQTT